MQKMELVKLTPEQIAEFAGIRMRSSASSRPRLQRAATVDVNMSSTARSETPSRGANSRVSIRLISINFKFSSFFAALDYVGLLW